jgi:PAS domain-containing protein
MLQHKVKFFAPFVFADDEEKTQSAAILHILWMNTLAALALAAVATLLVFARKSTTTRTLLIMMALLVIVRVLAQRGLVREACLVYVSGSWVIATLLIYFSGGANSVITLLYVAIMVSAAILLGRGPGFVVALLSIATTLGFAVLEMLGYPPPHYFPLLPLARWVALLLNLGLTITPLAFVLQNLTTALRRLQQSESLYRQQTVVLAALHKVALDLAAQQSLPDLLRTIVSGGEQLLNARGGAVYLYRPATDDLEVVFNHRVDPAFVGTVLKRGEGLTGQVLESGRSMAIADYTQWSGRSDKFAGTALAAVVAVPIFWAGRTVGVLNVLDHAPRIFSAADIAILERFAPLAAAALENARLYEGIKSTRDYYRTVLDSLHDQVIILDQDYHIVDVNASFLQQARKKQE